MAHRFEMFPLEASEIAALPEDAEYQGKPIKTAAVEATIPAELRADVSIVAANGRRRYPWRAQALREYDEAGNLVSSST